jgi:hypothetical protein
MLTVKLGADGRKRYVLLVSWGFLLDYIASAPDHNIAAPVAEACWKLSEHDCGLKQVLFNRGMINDPLGPIIPAVFRLVGQPVNVNAANVVFINNFSIGLEEALHRAVQQQTMCQLRLPNVSYWHKQQLHGMYAPIKPEASAALAAVSPLQPVGLAMAARYQLCVYFPNTTEPAITGAAPSAATSTASDPNPPAPASPSLRTEASESQSLSSSDYSSCNDSGCTEGETTTTGETDDFGGFAFVFRAGGNDSATSSTGSSRSRCVRRPFKRVRKDTPYPGRGVSVVSSICDSGSDF